jgi:hemoglobin/transferrin/lactoferrin receptor protein
MIVAGCLTASSLITPTGHTDAFSASAIEEILVVGARMPRPRSEVVGTVNVITYENIVDEMVTSLSDALRYTPGVSVVTADSRFGDTELTIRGLSGNRVASLIDGVPVPAQFDIGSFANAGQDFLIPDAVSRIEILRGPASTLFGNDALGGVVAIVTRDPEEFLGTSSSHLGGSLLYNGRDNSTSATASTALGAETNLGDLSGVLHVYHQTGHETDRSAVNSPDKQDRTRRSAYTKLSHILPSGNRLRLDASIFDEDVETDVVSVLGYGRQFRNTTSIEGDDSRRRYAVTGGYDFSASSAWLDQGRVNLYYQKVEVDQQTNEYRANLTPPVRNEREFSYDTDARGVLLDLESSWANHRIGWGAALERAEIEEQRDGRTVDLSTGTSTNIMLGEVMPVRDFPKSTVDELAVYVHDEISIGDFTVIPGLRFEAYDLDARSDGIYAADNPSTQVTDKSESSFAPKLGLLWNFAPDDRVYLQYAHGFRAPPFEDVNIGLDIPRFNIRALPNADLEAETSDGLELGLHLERDNYRLSFAVFGVEYDNLIETKVNIGVDPETGTLLFQSRNIDKARVYGAEVSLAASLEKWLPGFSLDAAASWTRGENRTTNEPLNTVDPPELVVALHWEPHSEMHFSLITTAVAKQDRIDDSNADLFATAGYAVVDLIGSYRLNEGARVDVGLFNAFDKTYWRWSSVRNRTQNDPMIDYLSAPGRYVSVSLRVDL